LLWLSPHTFLFLFLFSLIHYDDDDDIVVTIHMYKKKYKFCLWTMWRKKMSVMIFSHEVHEKWRKKVFKHWILFLCGAQCCKQSIFILSLMPFGQFYL
jgi:hypothetical protein